MKRFTALSATVLFVASAPLFGQGQPQAPAPVQGVPEVKPARRSGLLEVTLHPKFAENGYVYLTYHKPLPNDKGALALARGKNQCAHPGIIDGINFYAANN